MKRTETVVINPRDDGGLDDLGDHGDDKCSGFGCCAGRKVTRLEIAILRKACLQGLVGIWELGFWRVPTIPSTDLNCTMWFMLNSCFPSGSVEFWYVPDIDSGH